MKLKSLFFIFFERLARMSTAVFLSTLLALASVIGTVLPQDISRIENERHLYGETLYAFFSVMGFFDVYSSFWFLTLCAFLSFSLLACLFRNGYFHFVKKKKIKISLRLMGYYFLHIGILLLMLSGVLTGIFGVKTVIALGEDMVTDTVYKREKNGGLTPYDLPFFIQNQKFAFETYADGTPKHFSTELRVVSHTQKEITATVSVNKPLHFEGFSIYQSSYGDAGSSLFADVYPFMKKDIPAFQTTLSIHKPLALTAYHKLTLLAAEMNSAEPVFEHNKVVSRFENKGESVDVLFESPTAAPLTVRFYAKDPYRISVVDASGQLTPLALSLPLTDKKGWEIVRKTLNHSTEDRLETLTKEAEGYLSSLPKEERIGYALRLWKAVQLMTALNIPALLNVQHINKSYYTLLQVSRDPGFAFFCVAAFFIVFGMFLMVYSKPRK